MLKITLFGVGCVRHQTLLARLRQAVEELLSEKKLSDTDYELREVDDVEEFIKKGIKNIPLLEINGRFVVNGGPMPDTQDIKRILNEAGRE